MNENITKKDLEKASILLSDMLMLNTVLTQSLESRADCEKGGFEHVYVCNLIKEKICTMLDII